MDEQVSKHGEYDDRSRQTYIVIITDTIYVR